MERKHLVRDARDDAVLLVVGHPGPAALRRLRRDGREVEHRVRERRVDQPADGLARQGPHDADGVRVRAVGLLAEAEARAVLEACVESNFGRPTPSMRFRSCSMAWRFHAIDATLSP